MTVILYEVLYKQMLISQHIELENNVLLVKSIGFPFSPVNHLKVRAKGKLILIQTRLNTGLTWE